MERFDNRERLKKYFPLVPVFHAMIVTWDELRHAPNSPANEHLLLLLRLLGGQNWLRLFKTLRTR